MQIKDTLVSRLRNSIIAGEYLDGQRLKEADLCRRYQVSRTPVREALKELERECLVEIKPNLGARVRELTIQDVVDIYEILIMVEGVACRLACNKIDPQQINKLEEYQFLINRAAMDDNLAFIRELNHQFHALIVEASGNPYLVQIWKNFRHLSLRLSRFTLSPNIPDQLKKTLEQHPKIIDALKTGNPAMAEFVARNHLETGRQLLLDYLEAQQQNS